MSQPNLKITSSPHVHSGASIPDVMRTVIWALMPATALSVFMFGWPALLVILITMATCVATERLFNSIRKRPSSLGDQSAALTGLLLALTLPPFTPWWLCIVGGIFAIGVGKQIYGGLGYNMFNPALIARVFMLISFPAEMTSWPVPAPLFTDAAISFSQSYDIIFNGIAILPQQTLDAITTATPLGQYKMGVSMGKTVSDSLGGTFGFSMMDATSGKLAGSLGETSAVLLLGGGLYLIHKKIIDWRIPGSMLAGALVPAAFFWVIDGGQTYPDPLFHFVTGGLILGAFFMATDMVTSPVTPKGQIIFGASCGLLTYIIRTWGGYPEGVSFAVVIMNCAVPLIDQYTKPVIYGQLKKEKA
ncbi:MAG: RnfABCDGE type electron transport complex subunit D [Magnetococcales bacterium]|nr:RnfABCDGE type electron transport complex subunit D [Magnetococcales bacterium]